MITFSCKQCGGVVTQKAPQKHGRQPELCSEQCKKIYRKAYLSKWGAENKTKIREYRARIREQVHAWDRDFYQKHKERRKKLRTEYYKENRDRQLATAKLYAVNNPDRIRALGRKSANQRRARVMNAFVEVVDPAVVFRRDKGICGICRQPVATNSLWEVDHVRPLSKGGEHSYANVQLSHRRCNRVKRDKVPEDKPR